MERLSIKLSSSPTDLINEWKLVGPKMTGSVVWSNSNHSEGLLDNTSGARGV